MPVDHDIIRAVGTRARILELGCGNGATSIELARRGCNVTCIDLDERSIKRIRTQHEGINAHVADLNTYAIERMYDTIIMNGVLHFLSQNRALELINVCKEHTNLGGVNIVGALLEGDETGADGYYYRSGELRDTYADWMIVEYEESEEPDPDGGINRIAWLVAKRP